RPLVICAALTVFAAGAHGQSVFKCTNADGSISFQDRPCPKPPEPEVQASEEDGESEETGEIELEPAPAGFEWQRLSEVRGAVLRPVVWHFSHQAEGDELDYFLSREPAGAAGDFHTGLTIKVVTDVPDKTGMPLDAYARQLISEASSGLEIIDGPWDSARSPYVTHGALMRATGPGTGEFNAHMAAMANEETGTVYLITFEAPAESWDTIWPMGELMLDKLALNSGF
ncbi:MAG: DUF4124 domain-containing protein, partial [Gammaproteobacteria bacterium]